jgi:hypothetical protein
MRKVDQTIATIRTFSLVLERPISFASGVTLPANRILPARTTEQLEVRANNILKS